MNRTRLVYHIARIFALNSSRILVPSARAPSLFFLAPTAHANPQTLPNSSHAEVNEGKMGLTTVTASTPSSTYPCLPHYKPHIQTLSLLRFNSQRRQRSERKWGGHTWCL